MLQFRFKPTLEDLMVVTKAGLARVPGGSAVGAAVGPAGSDAGAVFRRLGWLLLIVGAVAAGVWVANVTGLIRMPSYVRFVVAAIGIGALSIGWQMRKMKLDMDMDKVLGDADASGVLANDSKFQKAVADMGEIEVSISSDRVQVSSSEEVVSAKWSDIATVRREGEYIVIAAKGLAGLIVALPPRALPEGTNHEAMLALLESLQRGEAVAVID